MTVFMEKLSERIRKMADSQTLKMSQKSTELRAQGIDIINLSVGEPDFFTPDVVKEAAKKAIDGNYTFYPPVPGYQDLREAISRKLKRENHLDYSPSQIIVSTGAKNAIANALLCLLDPGDEVIILAPYWVSYVDLVVLAEGVNVIIKGDIHNHFKVTPEQIKKAVSPKTRAIIINSPSNPTGSVYTYEEMNALADLLAQYPEIYILSDEIYEHINFSGKHTSMATFEKIRERVLLINGVSKAFSMTGWRIGYMAAPQWFTKACTKLQGQTTSGATTIAQKASLAAIEAGYELSIPMRDTFRKRRDMVIKKMQTIRGLNVQVPDGAFYVFPDISGFFGRKTNDIRIESADDLCYYLLEVAHVATVSGTAFGDQKCIRFSYATSEANLEEAMTRVKKALEQLK
jgi:aspartate aminotransferase